jgi:tRNA(His) guanylyltransferase
MANSKFSFVKKFEQEKLLLPGCFIVVRIDGRAFTKFCESLGLEKPNDLRALKLMNKAAKEVMKSFNEMVIAYG